MTDTKADENTTSTTDQTFAGTAETPVGGSEQAPDGDTTEAQHCQENGNREAAKWRTRLRETEAERDALAQRIATLQSREVERLASKDLSNPADLFTLGGVTVKDLLNETGEIDTEKVSAVVTEVLGTRPGLSKHSAAIDPSQGRGGTPRPKHEPSWETLLKDD
ncbi:hypothetical protein [Mycolicibacterium sp. XJ1904]